MDSRVEPMAPIAAKLASLHPLDEQDMAALLALPAIYATHELPGLLAKEGSLAPPYCIFITDGFAVRQKITSEGKRQILSFHMPGDFVDAQHLFLKCADHSVAAITPLEVIRFNKRLFRETMLHSSKISQAMWVYTLLESGMFREWMLNVGARHGTAGVCHLICEIAWRLEQGAPSDGTTISMPLTQEQIGAAVGLTPVHVNRILKSLILNDVIRQRGKDIQFIDWHRIATEGQFDPHYLLPH
ncbi:Crp/Fnr family transcriptional regulator [Xanthobacteraceae bacterium A53D]